jgi:hypothetical protein
VGEIAWENDNYRIEVLDRKAYAVEKESGMELASTIFLGDLDTTISTLKRAMVFQELGNPTSKVIWKNEELFLEIGFSGECLYLKIQVDNTIIASFNLDSLEVVGVIKKILAFL